MNNDKCMVIKETVLLRLDWICSNHGVLTMVDADGNPIRSVAAVSGYCKQGLGDALYALLNP